MQFITGSKYNGDYNSALHSMEGLGTYTYPDGSEYKGSFRNGKFHGKGQLTLSKPYSFTFVGIFEDGKLIEIDDMLFSDELHLKATIENNEINFANWKYCTERDRRYAYEISGGLGPVGQTIFMRNLAPNCYDIGGGIYKENIGFVVKIPPPFHSTRFVSCDKERDWITRNCRKGPYDRDVEDLAGVEPIPEIGQQIIDTNYKAMEFLNNCSCNQRNVRKFLQAQLSNDLLNASTSDVPTSLTTSISSFSDNSIEVPKLELSCREEVRTLNLSLNENPSTASGEELVMTTYVNPCFDDNN